MKIALCLSVVLFCGFANPYQAWSDDRVADEITLIVEAGEREIAAIKQRAEKDVQAAHDKCLAQLQQLQDQYTKLGALDQAVAVRDKLRTLKLGGTPDRDPGNLLGYSGCIGQVFYFEVMGATGGTIYGTDVYTADSHLATAAVHSGALGYAEKGVVKVTILPGKGHYEPSDRNEVSSRDWNAHALSYKVDSTKPAKAVKPLKQ
jgi:hypothetical protein